MTKKALQEEILTDDSYFGEVIACIEKAKKTIEIETYIFAFDAVGKKVIRALCKAADRGVKVRVLVDGAGTSPWGQKLKYYLESHNIKVKIYHPYPWLFSQYNGSSPKKKNFFSKFIFLISNINKRNHRKTIVIDKKILFIGSANIKNCYVQQAGKKIPLRDTSVKISNLPTEEVRYAFEKAWNTIPKLTFLKSRKQLYLRYNFSWFRRRRLFKDLIRRINHSKKRIWISNAYFVGNNAIFSSLKEAQARGVDVKIILPKYYEEPLFASLTQTLYFSLLNANLRIYEYQTGILHSKYIIIDDWYCLGSSNLNNRSLIHDLEVDVSLRTEKSKQSLKNVFITDLKNSKSLGLNDLNNISITSKIIGRLLLLIKYWL